MGRYLGEALTLRAQCYLDLVRFFGDVPFKAESSKSDLSNAYLYKMDRDSILDSLMVNLDEAIELLPWAGQEGYTTEHATKGYAHGLLAQIALTRAGYAIREKRRKATRLQLTQTQPTLHSVQVPLSVRNCMRLHSSISVLSSRVVHTN